MRAHLHEACIGQVSEIFDGDAPFTARGCFAQAWGVAEVLKVWGELDDGLAYEDRRKTQHHAAAFRK
jgi:glycogen debranching enzyme